MNPMNQTPELTREKVRKAVTSFVDLHREEQLDFLIRLCDQNSNTANKEGVDRVGNMILEHLGPILPLREAFPQEAYGSHIILRNRKSPGAVYLLGHMDTVFPPDHPFQKCQVAGDMLTGPGTGDMKGGLAVIIYALKALDHAGCLDELNLVLILGAEEEMGSITPGPMYIEESGNAAACLAAECPGPRGERVA